VVLPDGFQGVILDTASTSSFTALLAAREAAGLEVRERGLAGRPDLPSLAMYVSEQAHSSLEKAAIAAGLGQRGVRKIPTDDDYRMDVEALRRRISADVEAGIRPIMVCATIGTTSTTSVDPVAAIADVCEAMDVWLHVDAAYAGPAAMLPEARQHFVGWERADSIVINPHKWLATPMDCSTLLFRDRDAFRSSLALTPEYLSSDTQGVVNLMDYGLPLGRRFRALKLWFLFQQLGAETLREMLRRHLRLAGEFAGWIRADHRFELAAPVPFGTVCFRANAVGTKPEPQGTEPEPPSTKPEPQGADPTAANAWNRELLARLNRHGPVFLSHTVLDDRYTLRLSVGSVHTGERHVRKAYTLLCEEYDGLVREGWPALDR
jgi:aromatic-L-amino-acid decarboxylase